MSNESKEQEVSPVVDVDEMVEEEAEEGLLEPNFELMKSVPEEKRIKAFMQGEIQLADLYGLSHGELYDIATYGKMLYDEGKSDDAEKIFDALTALDPYDENFHAGLGAVYQKQGKMEEAIREYDRAVQCNEFHITSYVNRAEVCIMEGKLEEAIADLQKVMELDPEGKDDHTQRARGLAFAVASKLEELAEERRKQG